jgi:hypothetical protein
MNRRLRQCVPIVLLGLLASSAGACSRKDAARIQSADSPARRADGEKPGVETKQRISLSQLEDMFGQMRQESGLNVDGPLLWGYFFTDRDAARLKPLADHLASIGYRVVGIYATDDGSTNFLHVERVEAHTPKSLDELNTSFYALAERFGLDTYDGMDVGPAVANK